MKGQGTGWIRRCATLMIEPRETIEFDPSQLLRGSTGIESSMQAWAFAPHLAEELWERLGGKGSIFDSDAWPDFDPAKAVTDTVEFVVQVNGKVRSRMRMPRGISEEAARTAALEDANVQRFTDGKTPRKTIFVPDRLLNLVVG